MKSKALPIKKAVQLSLEAILTQPKTKGEYGLLFESHRKAGKFMEKSSRQKWAPPVIETVLLLRPAVKRGGKNNKKIPHRKSLGVYQDELLITVQTWKERVSVPLQYGSGGCSKTHESPNPIRAEREAKIKW